MGRHTSEGRLLGIYEPKGKMLKWLTAMRAEPDRIWDTKDACDAMGISIRKVGGYATYALRAGVIYSCKEGRNVMYALKPFKDGKPAPIAKPALKDPNPPPRDPSIKFRPPASVWELSHSLQIPGDWPPPSHTGRKFSLLGVGDEVEA